MSRRWKQQCRIEKLNIGLEKEFLAGPDSSRTAIAGMVKTAKLYTYHRMHSSKERRPITASWTAGLLTAMYGTKVSCIKGRFTA